MGCRRHEVSIVGCDECFENEFRTKTGRHSPDRIRPTPPLTEGYVRKGGHNEGPSQITQRPPPPGPSRIRGDTATQFIVDDVDYAHVEMRVVFMAGWDACFAKRDSEGNVPADADDREAAQATFLNFVKSYGGK